METFNNTWSSAPFANYNVWASTEANLNWFFSGWSGTRGEQPRRKKTPIGTK